MVEFDQLYKKYGDKVQFYFIYIREGGHHGRLDHAAKLGLLQWDRENRHSMPWKPFRSYNYADRIALAKATVKEMKITMPVLIDDLTSTASQAYFAWPDRSCLVDINGKIAFHGSAFKQNVRGNFFRADPLEKAIQDTLANDGRFVPNKPSGEHDATREDNS